LSKKILISLNTAWNLFNFRTGLIQAFIKHGYEVVAVATQDDYVERLSLLGCRFIHIDIDSKGTSLYRDLILLYRYFKILKKEKPNICLFYTAKPNIYGSLASSICRIPYINNVSGLGSVFIKGGLMMYLISILYWGAFIKSKMIFFQNSDDLKIFLSKRLIGSRATYVLPGSGVNLEKFKPNKNKQDIESRNTFRFLLIARMLKDKGVVEYLHAAQSLKIDGFNIECCLLGFLDVENPAAISTTEMDKFVRQGYVTYLGVSDDVKKHIACADCVVLPSYREGTPKSLLEAAAMAKPIITTNVAGCKNVVEDGVNGFLCEVKNVHDLENKMKLMYLLPNEERQMMGKKGRLKMELEFDENIVIQKYLQAINAILN
jgi:glycosyltransferase involved in cell wall biosynthesis